LATMLPHRLIINFKVFGTHFRTVCSETVGVHFLTHPVNCK